MDVEESMKRAFRLMPYISIYAPRGNTLEAVSSEQSSASFDIVAFSGTVLGDRSEERHIVLLWARSIASEGRIGGSIAEYCLQQGLDRSTFDRRRKRYCQRIADAKNRAERW